MFITDLPILERDHAAFPGRQPQAVHCGCWLCGSARDVSDSLLILSLGVAYAPVLYPMELIVAFAQNEGLVRSWASGWPPMAPATHLPRINISDADAATSRRGLSGVGETTAKAIVAYRESSGRFASVGELLEVKGIGRAIPDANRKMLHVN